MSYAALNQYRHQSLIGDLEEASPHKLIDMLFGGALDRLAAARGAIERGDVSAKVGALSSALDIVQHLKYSLDVQKGGRIASNLSSLYEYMATRLVSANLNSDVKAIGEVSDLLRNLKSAWAAMPQPA